MAELSGRWSWGAFAKMATASALPDLHELFKEAKAALSSYVREVNARPASLESYFTDPSDGAVDRPGLKKARNALRGLLAAWKPLTRQTPELLDRLHSMKEKFHSALNFQTSQGGTPERAESGRYRSPTSRQARTPPPP